jgi:hypothetical protein
VPKKLISVASGANDAHDGGTWDYASDALKIGDGFSSYLQFALPCRKAATIAEAILEVEPAADEASATAVSIYFKTVYDQDLTVDCSDLSGYANVVEWSPDAWTEGERKAETRIDVTSLAAKMMTVRSAVHVPGEYLTLLLNATGAQRQIAAYESGAENAARLLLRWSEERAGGVELAIEDMIADSDVWRSWVEAEDRFDALTRIHLHALPKDAPRPCCVIHPLGDDFEVRTVGLGVELPYGSVQVTFFEEVGTGTVDADGTMSADDKGLMTSDFVDRVSGVMADIRRLGRSDNYLVVRGTRTQGGVDFPDRNRRAQDQAEGDPIDAMQDIAIDFGTEGE